MMVCIECEQELHVWVQSKSHGSPDDFIFIQAWILDFSKSLLDLPSLEDSNFPGFIEVCANPFHFSPIHIFRRFEFGMALMVYWSPLKLPTSNIFIFVKKSRWRTSARD